jgi:hypothetical protein
VLACAAALPTLLKILPVWTCTAPGVLQSDRKKCIQPDCAGILVFIEGPNKYPILNIEEEVKVG